MALARPVVKQSAKTPTRSRIDETRTSVSIGKSQKSAEPIEIPSDSSSHESDVEEEQSGDEAPADIAQPQPIAPEVSKLKTSQDVDVDMEQPDGSDAEESSPTFGDLVRGNSTVDVTAALAAESSERAPRLNAKQRAKAPTNAISMGITLDQALRTDDNDLLESCLQIDDTATIENTINRMDSSLAGPLLSKVAARMHRRPGRANSLMKWLQWTLIAHGGSLVGQPDVVKRLGDLSRVLEERTKGLTSLLALKGKLDMLDAQMLFRNSSRGKAPRNSEEESEDEAADVDEPGVVFVEGDANEIKVLANGEGARGAADDDDDFPVINGFDGDSDEDSEDDEDFVDEDIDDQESMDEDEVDHDDVEESGEEESDVEDAAPPAKVQKVASRFPKRK